LSPKRLSHVIRQLREQRRHLTQVELARKAKLTQGYVTMIETGVRKNPSLAIPKRLPEALGVLVAELLA
jgi:transcriptional regulator with XRE-family HTH domain